MSDVPDRKKGEAVQGFAEPPVVARLMIEIRSDGTRTIARGLAEDVERGERVKIEAAGATPLALALSLIKQLTTLPALARNFASKFLKPPVK